ncbi:MAG: hypothetical protein J5742_02745 [Alphaproteobacteria bacterium]|nr:hypothetical protein [Alphaproteobacteria bacterium]
MIASKLRIFSPKSKQEIVAQHGGGLVEILLALVIVSVAAPFTYSMISETTHTMHNMAMANDIISLRNGVLNFIRVNQDLWPETAQIKLSDEELAEFSDSISAGFIDKYSVYGGLVIDVYLSFDFQLPTKRVAQIANNIGSDAAIVGIDGVAYGDTWAVTSPDFRPGNLIYKITRSLSDLDTARFLHRGSSGEDNLNVMERDLNMGGHDVYNVGGIDAKSIRVRNLDATFVDAESINAKNVYFSSGANVNGDNVKIGTLRVSGDVTGFRNIEAQRINNSAYTVNGRIIADRATINKSVNVARDFKLKSTSLKTISGFAGMTVGSVYAPYISTDEIIFYESFGLTVSGELLVSTTAPIKFGSWVFPSTTPPSFSALNLTRATMPLPPETEEFKAILTKDWKTK